MPKLADFNALVARTTGLRDQGARAALKRGLGRPLSEVPAAVPLLAQQLPERPQPAIDDALLLTAAACVTWPDLHRQRVGLGQALANADTGNADRRLLAATRASSDLLCQRHLPDLLRIIHKAGGHADLALLGWQAASWPEHQEETVRRWLRDYYRTATQHSRHTTDAAPATR